MAESSQRSEMEKARFDIVSNHPTSRPEQAISRRDLAVRRDHGTDVLVDFWSVIGPSSESATLGACL
jgi:hypothetical protein